MAPTPDPRPRWLCLLLLMLANGGAASAQMEAVEVCLSGARAPGESCRWPVTKEDSDSQILIDVSDTADPHNAYVRHRGYISPEESVSASVPDLPRLVALSAARLESGSACGEDSREFLRALNNFTLWAVNMYDSSVRAPTGVEYGSVYQLGHFDQCVSVRAQAGRVRGQYCLPQVDVRPLPSEPHPLPEDPYTIHFDQDQSAWLKLQFAGDRLKIRRDRWWWALCVPASCSPRQLQRALDQALRVAGPRMRLEMRAQLQDDLCSTDETPPPTQATAIFQCVVAALLVIATIGSWYDAYASKTDTPKSEKTKGYDRQIVECFSIQRNFQQLIGTNESYVELEIFGFLRVLTTAIIISGHRLILYGGFPLYNGEDEDKIVRRMSGILISSGTLFVDVCFTMGAMTLTIPLFRKFDRGAKFHHLFLDIINRYVRRATFCSGRTTVQKTIP